MSPKDPELDVAFTTLDDESSPRYVTLDGVELDVIFVTVGGVEDSSPVLEVLLDEAFCGVDALDGVVGDAELDVSVG